MCSTSRTNAIWLLTKGKGVSAIFRPCSKPSMPFESSWYTRVKMGGGTCNPPFLDRLKVAVCTHDITIDGLSQTLFSRSIDSSWSTPPITGSFCQRKYSFLWWLLVWRTNMFENGCSFLHSFNLLASVVGASTELSWTTKLSRSISLLKRCKAIACRRLIRWTISISNSLTWSGDWESNTRSCVSASAHLDDMSWMVVLPSQNLW